MNLIVKIWETTMKNQQPQNPAPTISTFNDLAKLVDYSLMDTLNRDPDSTIHGLDYEPRQVFSGHYVPVNPTKIENPEYIAHSKIFFNELGFADELAQSPEFIQVFTGDLSQVPQPMRKVGWATGYALSIYGAEYIQQCPFQTGNGYGDGRAVSVLEALINNQRWEMQLKGGGKTPYCRGADGRAVLRSSIREFLAQEHMHALGVPTSRSLSLYVSKTEQVQRPWYSQGSTAQNPDRMFLESVAISTRVAPSFLRVGQVELFARRARVNAHATAKQELEKIVLHVIDREYAKEIDAQLSLPEKVILLAREFQTRLTSMITNWIRVGFCQGNFNSDNCAVGGFTLDYGPFGFCDVYSPQYQPWTGGGQHFAFMNQGSAAQKNYGMFCSALRVLLDSHPEHLQTLNEIENEFSLVLDTQMKIMWLAKLGLNALASETDEVAFSELLNELQTLMQQTPIDYTMFFRELSSIPENIEPLKKSFYTFNSAQTNVNEIDIRWMQWLDQWKSLLSSSEANLATPRTNEEISEQMKLVNPKYILREWFLVPAYQQAAKGDYALIRELQDVMTQPYSEQSKAVEEKYYKLKPLELFEVGGLSHLSCSS